jgi:hypothetical protein
MRGGIWPERRGESESAFLFSCSAIQYILSDFINLNRLLTLWVFYARMRVIEKGKTSESWRRKAMGLTPNGYDCQAAEDPSLSSRITPRRAWILRPVFACAPAFFRERC